MPVKTAPENSGLVKVQWSNLKNINITIFYLVKVRMTVKAPENSGLVKVQLSNLINASISQNFLWWKWGCCKDCPRELWFGQGSVVKSPKKSISQIFSGERDDDCKDCPRELWFGQGSVIKSQKCIHITFFLVKVRMTVKAPENSGLVKVQWSNLKNISISQIFLVKATMTVKTAPENSGLVKVQLYQYHNILSGETDDDCKDCPRELWFGQVQLSNLTNISISQNSIWWKWRCL